MKKDEGPAKVTANHFKTIIKFLKATSRPQYALYFELIAYPGIKAADLRALRWKDVDIEELSVFGTTVLPSTMKTLWKFCKVKDVVHNDMPVFNFTKQRAHDIWLKCLEYVGLPKRTLITEYRKGFLEYLAKNYPGFDSTKLNGWAKKRKAGKKR